MVVIPLEHGRNQWCYRSRINISSSLSLSSSSLSRRRSTRSDTSNSSSYPVIDQSLSDKVLSDTFLLVVVGKMEGKGDSSSS